MLNLPRSVRIYVSTMPCDMRKQLRGLAAVVSCELGEDPRSGDLFLFLNRRKDMARIIFWDRSGLCMLSKRLDKGLFQHQWVGEPNQRHAEVSVESMAMLLRGD